MKLYHLLPLIPFIGVLVAAWLMDYEDAVDRARKEGECKKVQLTAEIL